MAIATTITTSETQALLFKLISARGFGYGSGADGSRTPNPAADIAIAAGFRSGARAPNRTEIKSSVSKSSVSKSRVSLP
jgi:hypothetical protein